MLTTASFSTLNILQRVWQERIWVIFPQFYTEERRKKKKILLLPLCMGRKMRHCLETLSLHFVQQNQVPTVLYQVTCLKS